MLNFTDALMELRRRAQLQGRPVTSSEVAGITAGISADASNRLARTKALQLQETGQNIQKEEFGQNLALETTKVDTQKQQFAEQLAFQKQQDEAQQRIARERMETERKKATGATVGTVIGGSVGYYYGGWLGAGIGAGIGGSVGGTIGGGCIIISSCTSPDSYEVNIAREFRDKYLDIQTLAGYYILCLHVVPYIKKHSLLKKLIKKVLVDRLVDYGEWRLHKKPKRELRTSWFVKNKFLGLCKYIGKRIRKVEV